MEKELNILRKLSQDDQQSILNLISNSMHNLTPIEIDNTVYEIPTPVYKLIDNLAVQIKELSKLYTSSSSSCLLYTSDAADE